MSNIDFTRILPMLMGNIPQDPMQILSALGKTPSMPDNASVQNTVHRNFPPGGFSPNCPPPPNCPSPPNQPIPPLYPPPIVPTPMPGCPPPSCPPPVPGCPPPSCSSNGSSRAGSNMDMASILGLMSMLKGNNSANLGKEVSNTDSYNNFANVASICSEGQNNGIVQQESNFGNDEIPFFGGNNEISKSLKVLLELEGLNKLDKT